MPKINQQIKETPFTSPSFSNKFAHYLSLSGFELVGHNDPEERYRFRNDAYVISISGPSITAHWKDGNTLREIASTYLPSTVEGFAHWLAAFSICRFSSFKLQIITA